MTSLGLTAQDAACLFCGRNCHQKDLGSVARSPAPINGKRQQHMRKNGIATLATLVKSQQYRDSSCYETEARGLAVLNSPLLNKGMAFTAKERKALGLTGLLPPEIITLEVQVKSAYTQYGRLTDALSKNIFLTALHDRNEVLFCGLFSEHLCEMIPIVNDHTVGMAIEHYHHECRRPRGVYLSIDHPGTIEEDLC
jgi:malate dehydrogenase (oxaloacetate-decarboxylating)